MARRKGGPLQLTPTEQNLLEALFLDRTPLAFRSPSALARMMRGGVTVPGLRIACKNLHRDGLLEMAMVKAPRQGAATPHYRLRPDLDGFRAVVVRYSRSLMTEMGEYWSDTMLRNLSGSAYAKQIVNEDLVRNTFAAKGLKMRHDLEPRSEGEPSAPRAMIRNFTLYHLPILATAAERKREINTRVAEGGDTPEERADVRRRLESGWETSELQNLIWPVLALLQISPTVLLQFLDEWNPAGDGDTVNTASPVSEIEHILYRWIFFAISDIARSRHVPDDLDVKMAEVRPSVQWGAASRGGLLAIHWRNKWILHYDSGFDTDHLLYGDGEDMFEVEINSENAWVRLSCEPLDDTDSRGGKPPLYPPRHRDPTNPKHIFRVLSSEPTDRSDE
jgi:hypothetical protein